jgi:tripartite-type tricarboxylate transporter receptor subunit TctC
MVAPPATPPAIADKISKDVAEVVHDPATADAIRSKLQMDPIGSTSAEAAKLFAAEATLWAKVIHDADVSLD